MKESDIRPRHIFDEYLRLSAADADLLFRNEPRSAVACPGCGQESGTPSFTKNGFGYCECSGCGTLYQAPRPSFESFSRFYKESRSSAYWAEVFFPTVAEARRAKIFAPRAAKMRDLVAARGIPHRCIIEIGAGHGIFLEEWGRLNSGADLRAIEPNPIMAQKCRNKGIRISQTLLEDADEWTAEADLVVCCEVLEHVYDVSTFLAASKKLLKPGGMAVFTCPWVEGFDIQVLWEHSKTITPPHHLNFLSRRGIEAAFLKADYRSVDVITPGKLDVGIVRDADIAPEELSRFVRLLLSRGEATLGAFQQFLEQHLLSSHCWILADA